MKRFSLVPTAIAFSMLFLFTACLQTEGSDAVMYVGDDAVGRKEFEYQLVSMMNAYEDYNGSPIDWSLPINGVAAADYFKDQAADTVLLYRAVRVKAEELGLSLTADELDQINQSVQDAIDQAGGEKAFDRQLADQGLDRTLYTYIQTGPQTYYKIFQALYGENGKYTPTDDDVRDYYHTSYLRTRHIMRYLTDENGEPLDKNAETELRKQMSDIYARLKEGEDFGALMNEYNEDESINGGTLSFSYGEMPEDYYQAAIALEPNRFSEVLEEDGCLCIIGRLPLDDAFLNENYDSIREEYTNEAFNKLLVEWKAS